MTVSSSCCPRRRPISWISAAAPHHGEAIGSFEGEPLYHGSLDAAEYRSLLAAQGFEVVSHVVQDPTCGRHTIWLARLG
ncbi:hypothetical protein [Ferrovibrio sp.]|uniref:hypothetical protein n=1 Tax=Ferrovibrio sp. TaxID=1917215 RepID=UPI003D1515BC